MNKQQAQNLIKETFERPFEKGRFTRFTRDLLNKIEDTTFTYQGKYIPDAYKPYVSSLERIGKYSDGEHGIDILIVHLKRETSLERARTMQRNFIAWYLNGSRGGQMKDAALVAFVSPGEADWRFSLVKMDYRFEETRSGKIKVKEEFTPARRWSFLVGSNEASHTAQSRLVPLLADDEHNPTLKQLENAFDIETVSKEFFLKYRDLFIRTKEALDEIVTQASSLRHEFETKGVDTVNFAKKLLGQIVFLYFLQKKGWFGVGRDAEWGTGSKHFLRELFKGKHGQFNNFFNDILEPLFYQALRLDRRHDDDYYDRFNCKIPFLNGGLFDPIGNYDWVHTDILLPNGLFSNENKTREGDTGDGILDIFDRYNFTVKEDEPLEKEVAIDPELLGKAYEKFNAIRPDNFEEYKAALKSGKKGAENKFNKKFGVYYTPREIVHYMCQQSLINYLYSVTQVRVTQASSLSRQSSSISSSLARSAPESHRQDACATPIALDTIMYFDPDAPISKKQRNLPHWQQTGTAYFVTFRLFDSIPKETAESIRKEREQWLKSNNIADPSELKNLSRAQKIEYYRLFSRRYDELLDNGYGCCVLEKPECKKIVEDALKHFVGERYSLDCYVVMPNHAHVIVIPKPNWDLSKITHSWKSFTANEINKVLGRKGPLWMAESFDHIIRSPLQLEKIRQYIADNPKKSKAAQASVVTQASQPECSQPEPEPSPANHRQDACATISKEDLETLIKFGEQVGENEAAVLAKEKKIAEGKQKTTKLSSKLPESIRQNAGRIDDALANITVCDPAIGSGAFPVGMMHEIVKTRNVLTHLLHPSSVTQPVVSQASSLNAHALDRGRGGPRQDAWDTQNARTTYQFKRQCIEKSLYGVDIDPGAVEIAKLRLWLSLVVDEDDIRQIKPLPNLNYKIVRGNSLLGVEKNLFNNELFAELERLKPLYFDETNPTKKQEYKKQIDSLISEIVTQPSRLKGRHMPYRQDACDTVFDFEVYFSEVFHEKGGFDVVIANPPYKGIEDIDWDTRRYFETLYKTATGRFDLYSLFIEKAMQIKSRSSGVFAFIIPGKFLNNKQFVTARRIICKKHGVTVVKIDNKIFDEAQVNSVIVENYLSREFSTPRYKTFRFIAQRIHPLFEVEIDKILEDPEVIFRLEINTEIDHLISKIKKDTFRIKEIAEVKDGIVAGAIKDILFLTKRKDKDSKRIYFGKHLSKYHLSCTNVSVNYKPEEMMKEEIKRKGSKRPGLWMRNPKIFNREKILSRFVAKEIIATYDNENRFYEHTLHSTHIIDKRFKTKYVVGLFNSKLFKFYYQKTNSHGGNIFPQIRISSIENLPIKLASKKCQDGIENLVDRILAITKDNDYLQNPRKQAKVQALEREIDQMVYQLYGLTEEEIKIVEGKPYD